MTSLRERPNTALLVVDVQNDVVANALHRDEVIANINTLVDNARARRVPVIWVQHSDDDCPRTATAGSTCRSYNARSPSRSCTRVTAIRSRTPPWSRSSAERGVGRLVVAGAQTDACIRSTLHGAFTRGYDTVLVGDAHTTDDYSEYGLPPADKVIAHTNMYWAGQAAPGRTAGVVETADVAFDASGAEAAVVGCTARSVRLRTHQVSGASWLPTPSFSSRREVRCPSQPTCGASGD